MPIENERSYVLDDPESDLFRWLDSAGHVRGYDVLQAYLEDDTRIRRFAPRTGEEPFYEFSYKRKIRGEQVEVEAPMAAEDFDKLFPRAQKWLTKYRFKFAEDPVDYDVDFFHRKGRIYFVKAEAEMPLWMRAPQALPACVTTHLLLDVDGRAGFGNRRLAKPAYARSLLSLLRARAIREDRVPSLDPSRYADAAVADVSIVEGMAMSMA